MIEARDVNLIYSNGTNALKNVNLHIGKNEAVYIMGPSGSGKTSLLKLFMGMEYPTSGRLSVLGQDISKNQYSKIRLLRKKIGPIFQEFKLIKGRTALENVMLGMRFLGIPQNTIKEEALSALVKVGLEHKTNAFVENLSWGETQRVAIARAVARKPELILADEPTGNLDTSNSIKILELLASFKDNNTSVVITTHAAHLVEGIKEGKFLYVDEGTITINNRRLEVSHK